MNFELEGLLEGSLNIQKGDNLNNLVSAVRDKQLIICFNEM